MGFHVKHGELLDGATELELRGLITFLREFLLTEHHEDGTHRTEAPAWTAGPFTFTQGALAQSPAAAVLAGGSVNDYAPDGIDTAVALILNSSSSTTLTGLKAVRPDRLRFLFVYNSDSTNVITLAEEDGGSVSQNRFQMPGGVDYDIAGRTGAWLMYEPTGSRWVVAG